MFYILLYCIPLLQMLYTLHCARRTGHGQVERRREDATPLAASGAKTRRRETTSCVNGMACEPRRKCRRPSHWLESMADDVRDVSDVSGDLDFDSRKLSTRPFHAATERISVSQGWPTEIFRGILDSNSGFLESVQTTINHDKTLPQGCTPVKSVAAGCVPSARKTGMLDWLDALILTDDGAGLQTESCKVAEATKKGIDLLLLNSRRASTRPLRPGVWSVMSCSLLSSRVSRHAL